MWTCTTHTHGQSGEHLLHVGLGYFHEYQPTLDSFLDLFARLRKERLIPAR